MTKKKTDWAYLAGLIDGEGCLTIANHKCFRKDLGREYHHHQSAITVGNTWLPLIQWIVEKFGGNCYTCPKQYNRRKIFNEWRVGGKEHQKKILLGVLPYLIEKREQAIVMLEFLNLSGSPNIELRSQLAEKIQVLNQRGKSLTTNTPNASPDAKIESELASDCKSELMVTLAS